MFSKGGRVGAKPGGAAGFKARVAAKGAGAAVAGGGME